MSKRGKKVLSGIFFLCVILSLSSAVFAEDKIIKLKDGVVLRGKVLAKEGELYKISTRTVGTVFVKDSDILSITAVPSQGVMVKGSDISSTGTVGPPDLQRYQENIMNNPDLMESMKVLSEDQELIELLEDPKVKTAIMNQDIEFLRNNEKFQRFMENDLLKNIIGDITTDSQQMNKTKKKGFYGGKN